MGLFQPECVYVCLSTHESICPNASLGLCGPTCIRFCPKSAVCLAVFLHASCVCVAGGVCACLCTCGHVLVPVSVRLLPSVAGQFLYVHV